MTMSHPKPSSTLWKQWAIPGCLLYFTQVDTSTRPDLEMLAYIGLEYGLVGGSGYPAFSHFSDPMFEPDFPATYACHAEVEFLLAEAAARGTGCGWRFSS